jgi:hypothetical protein
MNPYIALTAHFMHNENLSILLDFALISNPLDGQQIKSAIHCILEDYCIINNVIFITTDNAPNNVPAIKSLYNHMNTVDTRYFEIAYFEIPLTVKAV